MKENEYFRDLVFHLNKDGGDLNDKNKNGQK